MCKRYFRAKSMNWESTQSTPRMPLSANRKNTERFEQGENEKSRRVQDRNYSNLFGREFYHPRASKTSSQMNRSESLPCTPARKKVNSFDKILYSSQKESKLHETSKLDAKTLPKPRDATTETYEISGLNTQQNESFIKSLCKGCHIVSISPQRDSITGISKGKALLKVRHLPNSESKSLMHSRVKSEGLKISPCKQFPTISYLKSFPVETPRIKRTQSLQTFSCKASPRVRLKVTKKLD